MQHKIQNIKKFQNTNYTHILREIYDAKEMPDTDNVA